MEYRRKEENTGVEKDIVMLVCAVTLEISECLSDLDLEARCQTLLLNFSSVGARQ